jgi:hypothetical protein
MKTKSHSFQLSVDDRFDVDNTDPASVSNAMVQGRQMAAQYRDALTEHHPAFANSFLVATGAQIGIRETRRIVGDYVLTLDDYMQRRSFTDEICRNSYFIDIRWAKEEVAKSPEQHVQWAKTNIHYGPGESHGIPYRCLTPQHLTNVVVAGRSISAEQVAQGSIRVMPVCLAMGKAAGVAAALVARAEVPNVHAVDVCHLRKRFTEEGAYLPDYMSPGRAQV